MAKKVSRPKLVKDWDKMPKEIVAAIKAEYPNGFSHKLINYTTPKGEKVLALPYDTDDIAYLVRVTVMESKNVFKDDDDDDDVVSVKAPREDLDLDGLDIDGLKEEDDSFSSVDEDEDEYVSPARRRRTNNDDDDDDDDY